ncbi:Fungal STAND N-terminal Goodbye domain-containing protein [Pleurotus pulmonarius]
MLQPRKNSASSARNVVGARSDQGSIIPSVVYAALKTIALSSQGCPFPPVVVVANLALDIWDKATAIRKNKAEFRNLAYVAGHTVKTIWDEIHNQVLESGVKISDSFERSVEELSRIVEEIHTVVCAYAGRGFFRRFFCSESDLGCIADFQQQLDQAKRNFELVAIISVRATVERIEQNQRHIRGAAASNVAMSNTGGGVFNNVVGNQYNDLTSTITRGQQRPNALKGAPHNKKPWGDTYGVEWDQRGEIMASRLRHPGANYRAPQAKYCRMRRQVVNHQLI